MFISIKETPKGKSRKFLKGVDYITNQQRGTQTRIVFEQGK